MDIMTLAVCVLLWILISILAYFVDRTPVVRQWLLSLRPISEDEKHDVERAMDQLIPLRKGFIVAIGLATLVSILQLFAVDGIKKFRLGRYTIHDVISEELGLSAEASSRQSTVELLAATGESKRQGFAQKFMGKLTGSQNALVTTSSATDAAKRFFELEDELDGALDAYCSMLVENIESASDSDKSRESLNDFVLGCLVESTSTDNTFNRLASRGIEGDDLKAVKESLERDGEDEGRILVIRSLYDRLRDRAEEFDRVSKLCLGWIQWLTLVIYFLALIQLCGRRILLKAQYEHEDGFTQFVEGIRGTEGDKETTDEKLKAAGEVLTEQPKRNSIFPPREIVDERDVAGELCILGAWFQYLKKSRSDGIHLFVPSALQSVLVSVFKNSMRKRGGVSTTDAVSHSLSILRTLVGRTRDRIDEVGYSSIDFLLWAMPSLGFIGTILGIAESLGNADLVVRAADAISRGEAVTAVTSFLGLAFDTTLIALVCSIPVTALSHWGRSREFSFILNTEADIAKKLFHEDVAEVAAREWESFKKVS